MTVTISALFDDHATAVRTVTDLEDAGLASDDISIVSNNAEGWYSGDQPVRVSRGDTDRDGVDDRVEGATAGAGIGAVAGGVAGALAGLGLLAIPGIGPVVAAGLCGHTGLFTPFARRPLHQTVSCSPLPRPSISDASRAGPYSEVSSQ